MLYTLNSSRQSAKGRPGRSGPENIKAVQLDMRPGKGRIEKSQHIYYTDRINTTWMIYERLLQRGKSNRQSKEKQIKQEDPQRVLFYCLYNAWIC